MVPWLDVEQYSVVLFVHPEILNVFYWGETYWFFSNSGCLLNITYSNKYYYPILNQTKTQFKPWSFVRYRMNLWVFEKKKTPI